MLPTFEQISHAAYERWNRRGRSHGDDRSDWLAAEDELAFSLNYQPVATYSLIAPEARVLHDGRGRHCRFCERTLAQVAFSPPMPLLANGWSPSLAVSSICDECRTGFHDDRSLRLERFRSSLSHDQIRLQGAFPMPASAIYSFDVFKALVGCVLLVLPERELGYFVDTLEWVSNPHEQSDSRLLQRDASCVVYLAPFWAQQSWISIARRIENDAPLPYTVSFLALRGVILQISLPMCARDQDLDGREVRIPRRAFAAGDGESFQQARALTFP